MPSVTDDSELTGRMLEGLNAIEDLRDQWNRLWIENNGISVQCYSYCLNSWKNIHKPHNRKIQCAVVFENEQLVAVWPLLSNYKAVWKVVRPVGPATAEFTEPLVELDEKSDERIAKLWEVVKTKSGADIINLPFVRQPTPLAALLSNEKAIIGKEVDTFHHLYWPDKIASWDEYYNTLGNNHRKKLAQRRRSFDKLGTVTYDIITDPKLMEPHVYWILEQKREWAKHVGLRNPGYWLTSNDYANFLIDWANDVTRPETVRIDLLRLDGEVVAAFVVCVGTKWLEWIIGGYSAKYTKYSPGMYLQYCFVRWGYEHNLEPDFGVGAEDNKKFWCYNRYGEAAIYHIANSLWGKIGYKAFYSVFQKFKNSDKKSEIE
jgi:CelD/BcsL family acetyltransferase involved in cellulose biosynthesis